MSERLEIPRTQRKRRSHAERSAETQSRIKRAVVEAIADLGFHRTTAAEISRRAGVSWGAAQHHFGDKDGILIAVLVDSFNRFAERLASIAVEGAPLEERVATFVDAAWEHFASPHYRCTFEILLNMPSPDWASRELPLRDATLDAWRSIWHRFFGDAGLTPRKTVAVQYYTISVLSGLAAMKRFEGPTAERHRIELGLLEDTLVRELGRGSD
ncbi:MAG: TetR/AcrR family transcriptional regulator [Deltaproteobacteria bacterium]|nr:TetR/AcrR family transcriptional regulator [Deltaproteobacteria bacterium]MBW2361144.1 TetR/AcrR family transcriptional regulator [Deltaproteobacteria bacterium]